LSKVKGVVYLHVSMGWLRKSEFDVRRDFIRMRDELNANAVRLQGYDDWLLRIAEIAKEEGLMVWLQPKLPNVVPEKTFKKLLEKLSEKAEKMDVDVFLIGNELSLEVNRESNKAIDYTNRCLNMRKDVIEPLRANPEEFVKFISDLVMTIRVNFNGKISYASGSWEFDIINWKAFDIVCCNQFYFSETKDSYLELLLKMKEFNKPAVLTEYAFMTIDKSFDAGPLWWYPKGHKVKYDEDAQAECLSKNIELIKKAGLDGCFVHQWQEGTTAGLGDMGFGIVRMNGKPKKSFFVVKEFYEKWKSVDKMSWMYENVFYK